MLLYSPPLDNLRSSSPLLERGPLLLSPGPLLAGWRLSGSLVEVWIMSSAVPREPALLEDLLDFLVSKCMITSLSTRFSLPLGVTGFGGQTTGDGNQLSDA
jgi:hypothetical protein